MTGREDKGRGCLGCRKILALLSAGGVAAAWSLRRGRASRANQDLPGTPTLESALPAPTRSGDEPANTSDEGQNAGERRRETLTYLVGYGLALALTLAAFAFVEWPVAAFGGTFAIILALALVQLIVQFRCFLHISLARSARADLLLVLFASLIVTLMVSGTLVILFNLRERMM